MLIINTPQVNNMFVTAITDPDPIGASSVTIVTSTVGVSFVKHKYTITFPVANSCIVYSHFSFSNTYGNLQFNFSFVKNDEEYREIRNGKYEHKTFKIKTGESAATLRDRFFDDAISNGIAKYFTLTKLDTTKIELESIELGPCNAPENGASTINLTGLTVNEWKRLTGYIYVQKPGVNNNLYRDKINVTTLANLANDGVIISY